MPSLGINEFERKERREKEKNRRREREEKVLETIFQLFPKFPYRSFSAKKVRSFFFLLSLTPLLSSLSLSSYFSFTFYLHLFMITFAFSSSHRNRLFLTEKNAKHIIQVQGFEGGTVLELRKRKRSRILWNLLAGETN